MTSAHHTGQSKKAAASGWIGSALEYYDFFIYATAASLIFPQIFFPSGNPTIAIVASLATYGVGYVARPIGAVVLGHWGDTHGRKTVLILCMFLMGFSTMAVGLLPTYQQVGVLAPVLLVVLRLIQGFAVAGEISGASSMILEHAPFGRRGFYASFALQGVQAGQILAAAVFLPLAHYMPEEAFNSWGWRIPFLLSFFVIIAGYIIRRKVDETPAFAEESEHGEVPKAPIIQAFRNSWRDMLRVVCMALMNVIPVVASIFGAAYAVQAAYGIGFEKDIYLWIPVLGNIVAVLVIPFVGNLSDKIATSTPSASIAYPWRSSCRCSCGASSTKATTPFTRAFTPNSSRPAPASRRWPSRRMSAQRSRHCSRRFSQPWRRPARPTSLSRSARSPLPLRLSRRLRPGAPGRPIESISRISVNQAPFPSTKAITTACGRQA